MLPLIASVAASLRFKLQSLSNWTFRRRLSCQVCAFGMFVCQLFFVELLRVSLGRPHVTLTFGKGNLVSGSPICFGKRTENVSGVDS